MSRASPARLARRQTDRAVDEVLRVRAAADAHARALHDLLVAVAHLPRPSGASEREETDFKQSIVALAKDAGDLVRVLGEDIERYLARGVS